MFLRKIPYLLLIMCLQSQFAAVLAQAFTSSNLPIVVLQKKEAWQQIDSSWDGFELRVFMGVIDNQGRRNNLSDPYTFSTDVSIKRQGSSSVAFPKKSYRITTLNAAGIGTDVSLLGMPAHEDWVLKALYQDKSLVRDDLAFKMYRDMGHYSSRSVFFELVVDGDYRGVYHLLEKVKRDKDRVAISKLTQQDVTGDDLTGGYIVSLDKFVPGVDKGWYSKYKSSPGGDSANFYLYVYPKGDSIMPQQAAYIQNYIGQFEDAAMSAGTASQKPFHHYINMQSFADNFIINELSRNVDGYRASTYFYKDRQSAPDPKLNAGPLWDYNLGFGNCVNNFGNDPYWWAYDQPSNVNFIPFWWKKLMADSMFKNELRCRYQELRKNVLSEEKLFQHIDQRVSLLQEAQQRNFQRYPILGTNVYPTPVINPPAHSSEVGHLKWWLHERLGWMDKQLTGTCIVSLTQNNLGSTKLNIYPNPVKSNLTLEYNATEGARVKIELLSVTGRQAMLVFEGSKSEGAHVQHIDLSVLEAGTYIMRLSVNGSQHHQKVVKLENK